MSEMRHRRQIRSMAEMAPQPYHQQQFLWALLESQLPLQTQLEWIFQQDDFEVLNCAILVAVQLELDAFAPQVVCIIEKDIPEERKFYWTWQIGSLAHEVVDQYLMSTMQSDSPPRIRSAAVEALRSGHRPWVVEPMLALACDPAQPVELRHQAFKVLINQSDKSLLPYMLTLLQHEDVIVRAGALIFVEHYGDFSLTSFIEPLLNDSTQVPISEVMIKDLASAVLLQWAEDAESK